jgi:hypothetical protein
VGDIGWTEGWIQFNCCFNISLSYLAKDETKINLKRIGKEVLIQMHAPLNFDEKSVEKATVMVSDGRGKEIALELVEDNVNARTFSRKIKMPATGKLQVRHGYGYLASTTSL